MTAGQILIVSVFGLMFIVGMALIIIFWRRDDEISDDDKVNYDYTLTTKSGYLTDKEFSFYQALLRAAEKMNMYAFPKVAIKNIIANKDAKNRFNMEFSFCVDFCIFTKNDYSPVLVVDLYDNTIGDQSLHRLSPTADRIVHSVGLPILAIMTEANYNIDELKMKLESSINDAVKNAIGKRVVE